MGQSPETKELGWSRHIPGASAPSPSTGGQPAWAPGPAEFPIWALCEEEGPPC